MIPVPLKATVGENVRPSRAAFRLLTVPVTTIVPSAVPSPVENQRVAPSSPARRVTTVTDSAAMNDAAEAACVLLAAGAATVKGEATWVGSAERSRAARIESFEKSTRQMIEGLPREVGSFRGRAPRDPTIRLVLPPGYAPASPRPPG